MKKKLYILNTVCLLLLATLVANSQEPVTNSQEKTTKLQFGIKAGINVSNVWDSKGQDFVNDAKVGFIGGVFLGIPFGEYVGIQPEVHYSQKGFKGSGTILGASYSTNRITNYLDIPILFQIKPSPYITLLVGPQYSYLLSQTDTYTFAGQSVQQEQEFKNDNVRKNIFGLVGGFDINYQNYCFSARASWDLENNNGDGTSTTPRYKNQLLQFTLGFKL